MFVGYLVYSFRLVSYAGCADFIYPIFHPFRMQMYVKVSHAQDERSPFTDFVNLIQEGSQVGFIGKIL